MSNIDMEYCRIFIKPINVITKNTSISFKMHNVIDTIPLNNKKETFTYFLLSGVKCIKNAQHHNEITPKMHVKILYYAMQRCKCTAIV